MNKYLDIKGVVVVFCVLAFFACNQKKVNNANEHIETEKEYEYQQNSKDEINEINDIVNSSEILTALPFDLEEWAEWKTAIDMTETVDDGRYKSILLSENENLKQLVDAIYPQYFNTHYFILKSDKTDCVMYIIVSTQRGEVGLYFCLINIQDNKKIDSLPLGALLDGERKNFNISENLEITLFDEKIVYSEEEDRTVVVKKEKTGRYQIQRDGKIVKGNAD